MKITSPEKITNLLQQFQPDEWPDFAASKYAKNICIDGDDIFIDLVFPYPVATQREPLLEALKLFFQSHTSQRLHIHLNWEIVSHVIKPGLASVPGVKNIIAVASGKGGVGKSTTAVNLALALKLEGAQVGILDADIYGPNQPHMLGSVGQQPEKNEIGLQPIMCHGIQSMSMAYMIDPETPMIWRGPMISQALQQLLNETEWKNLDYLIVDLPPGTGDIQLTLAQKVPVTAAIIVTTPQDIALLDARKALEMFKKVNIPVLGIIENMSLYQCKNCGHQEAIFASGGAEKLSTVSNCEVLGSLPLDIQIREQADQGKPIVVAQPESANTKIYQAIARRVAAKLSLLPKNYASKFPKIIMEND